MSWITIDTVPIAVALPSVTVYWNEPLVAPADGWKLNEPLLFSVTVPPVTVQTYGAMTSAQPTTPVTVNGSPSTSVSLSATPLPDGVVSLTDGVMPDPTSTRSSVLPSVSHVSLCRCSRSAHR
jgi:hypothetical protein